MSELSLDDIADAMYEMVNDYYSKKNLKAMDLIKAMRLKFGEDKCDKKICKLAIRKLIDSGSCIYSYIGGSYITLPKEN